MERRVNTEHRQYFTAAALTAMLSQHAGPHPSHRRVRSDDFGNWWMKAIRDLRERIP